MTSSLASSLDRIRRAALVLPEAEERSHDGQPAFLVGGEVFAALTGDGAALRVRADEGEADWASINLAGDLDWPMIEDRIAHGWELVAPRGLLEAGGR